MTPDNNTAILILCVSFTGLLILRFPVALTLALSSLVTLIYLKIPVIVVAQQMIQGVNSFSLLAIPFFILTGQILSAGGLARRIIDFTNVFVGRLVGGLPVVNSIACMFFGGLSGSAVADASAIGSVMIPAMSKKGYSTDYAVGVTISSSIQGVLLPPSHNMILYVVAASGIAGGLSIAKLFLAGMMPGLVLLIAMIIVGLAISIKNKYPKGDPVEARKIPMILLHGLISLTPVVIILGSIIFGWATATEAGALAAVYAFLLCFFFYRELTLDRMWPVLVRTFRTILMVFFLIGTSAAFGWIMNYLHLPDIITEWFLSVSDQKWVILLMINILLLILGGPMDMAPMILILTPVLLPVVMKLGMDPVQFGIIIIFNAGMGLLTPPVGTVLFVGCAIGKISMGAGTKAMMPFFLAMIVALFLVTYIPAISMWLPGLFETTMQ
ncbi:MAG: TRAP transporter large permease [Deltaproteobacteria bacterium]|nr:TRAP transporter large permease [Deltaproteobacteria bacterium]